MNLDFFNENEINLKEWGDFVCVEINRILDSNYKKIVKIPAKVRVKEIESIKGKLFKLELNDSRGLDDLVGIRYVVLLNEEIIIVASIIEKSDRWSFTKNRDYLGLIEENPESFDYQSDHFVVSPKEGMTYEGKSYSSDLKCEIQVRTLLQHAYAELTHDNIYKPVVKVPAKARRFVARSMALMESTDELFSQTLNALKVENLLRNEFLSVCESIYIEKIGQFDFSSKNFFYEIFESTRDVAESAGVKKMMEYYNSEKGICLLSGIKTRTDLLLLKQPVVLYVAWQVSISIANAYRVQESWAFDSLAPDLKYIYSLLGRGIKRYE